MALMGSKASGLILRRIALLVCGTACLWMSLPAFSQEAGLRGAVEENGIASSSPLKKKSKKPKAAAQPAIPIYKTENAGALPAEQDEASKQLPDPIDAEIVPIAGAEQDSAPAKTVDGVLPSEVPEPGATASVREDEEPEVPLRAERDNLPERALDGRRKRADAEPYAAPGISSGAFTVRPTLETGIRWTSNSDSSASGKPAFLSETNLRLRADSNWSRHRLGLEATGSWQKSLSGADTNDPEAGLAADFQLDFSDRTALTGSLGWNHSIEAASAPATVVGALSRPDLNRLTGALAISHDLGLIGVRARLNAERSAYGDATDSLGAAVSQEDRNNSYLGLTLRAGYDISAALSPFVEAEAGRRVYDNETDSFGLERAATRLAIRTGVEADFGEKLRGDIAAGYLIENIDDPALEDISGLSLAGTLTWSPMRGTSVAITASTTVEGSSTATSSGSLLNGVALALTHRARENLDLTANVGARLRNYSGPNPNEITLSAGAGFTYWFNRYVGMNSRIAHETVLSSDATRESQTNSVFLGMTFRR